MVFFKRMIDNIWDWACDIKFYYKYVKRFKCYLKENNIPNIPIEGEKNYIRFWKQISSKVECQSYRLFSNYCGKDSHIIPEYIGEKYIQELLSPSKYRPVYRDKNLYLSHLGAVVPKTIICRQNGSNWLDYKYNTINLSLDDILSKIPEKITSIVLKPTIDSSSGKGVIVFKKNLEGIIKWQSKEGLILNVNLLNSYGKDWVLQEGINQHSFLSQFCNTSVNTFRICTYRSVLDEKVHVTSAVLRIGKIGNVVDNVCAGGKFVGIDIKNGKLDSYVCDKTGKCTNSWNNINFELNTYIIPYWDKVIIFAKKVAKNNRHCRALGLDITLNLDGIPILIEYNVDFYGYWLFMFTGQKVFGNYLEEIVEYCKSQIKN